MRYLTLESFLDLVILIMLVLIGCRFETEPTGFSVTCYSSGQVVFQHDKIRSARRPRVLAGSWVFDVPGKKWTVDGECVIEKN